MCYQGIHTHEVRMEVMRHHLSEPVMFTKLQMLIDLQQGYVPINPL